MENMDGENTTFRILAASYKLWLMTVSDVSAVVPTAVSVPVAVFVSKQISCLFALWSDLSPWSCCLVPPKFV